MFLNDSIDSIPQWNPNRYTIKKYLSNGSFGTVFEGCDNVDHKSVAIKSIIIDGKDGFKAAYREICILHHMQSHYLLRMIDSKTSLKDGKITTLWLVLPLMEYDLHSIIYKKNLTFQYCDIIRIIFQILKGLQYLCEAGIIHRDLKPSNVGINSNCDIKILDFGMSRDKEEDMTRNVTTPYYRAIEVFCEVDYTTAIDMWSTGCIFTELFTKKVLFKGKKIFDQIKQIIKITGLPKEKIYPNLESYRKTVPEENQLRNHIKKDIENFGCYLDEKDSGGAEYVIKLICWMLQLNPAERPTPQEALNSDLFKKYNEVVQHYQNDKKPKPFICDCAENTLDYFKEKIEEEINREFDLE